MKKRPVARTRALRGGARALVAAVATTTALATSAYGQSFNSVRVVGNERTPSATVLSYLGAGGGTATAAQINDGYQALVNSGLFESVELVTEGSSLVVRVVERPTISRIAIEGNRRLEDEDLRQFIESTPRRVFTPAQAEADADTIAAVYAEQGRVSATVTPRIIRRPDNRVDLVFEVDESGVVEIERLSFTGNRAFTDRRLRRVLETRQAGLLRRIVRADTLLEPRLELDRRLLQDFYLARGYADFDILSVNVERTPQRDRDFVTFNVQEGQQYRIGRVVAVSEVDGIPAAPFTAELRFRPGAVFSPSVVEQNIVRLEEVATRRGDRFIRIEPEIDRDPRTGIANVILRVQRGPRVFVERIDIEGNATTLDRVIRRQFRTVEGDPFDPREVRAAAERIRALGFFSDVAVDTVEGSEPGLVVVDVDVEETTTGSLSFGASYGGESGVGFNVAFGERNFLGRGQAIALRFARTSDSITGSFDFFEPAFLGRDVGAGFRIYANSTDSLNASFNTESIGFSPRLVFPVSDNGRVELRYRIEQNGLDIPEGATGVAPLIVSEASRGDLLTSAIGYTYTLDRRNLPGDPDIGYAFSFGQDFAGIGGDARYVRTVATAQAERAVLRGEVNLRAEIEGGAIIALDDYETRVTERFFTSGRTFRGFESRGIGPRDGAVEDGDPLGGNYYAVARIEGDFPLGFPEEYGLRGGAFLDVGSVWGLDVPTNAEGSDEAALRAAIGVSLFVISPFGPLRFNFSRPLVEEEFDRVRNFDFTIATEF
ncbi:Beta-barrel assembly machine subunit BamA [Hasllibacter halocynthiae]|uniref:Outer membrane protein assembly factor BamA n=1 Tax=Hasllibacter halocynthiae TaxID=595589 RepID=A0A2T0X895_9RHOB|nr:outer membrane protein assembly factor BamA [Hasllibacter halocynthiae]PRY95094.1 Beta-barrel assembly machine subunit BamA [Hasllibacter halocynthiae]